MSVTIFETSGILISICLNLDYKSFNQFVCTCRIVARSANHPAVWMHYLKQVKEHFVWWNNQRNVAYAHENYDVHFDTIFDKLETIINSNPDNGTYFTKSSPKTTNLKQAYLDLKSEFSDCIIMLDDYLSFDSGVYVGLDTSFFVGKFQYINIIKSLNYWPPTHRDHTSGPLHEEYRQMYLHSLVSPIDIDDQTVVVDSDGELRSAYYHNNGDPHLASMGMKDSLKNGMYDPEFLKIIYDHLTRSKDLVYAKLGYNLEELALAISRRYMYNYRYYDLNPKRILPNLIHVTLKQLNQEIHACQVITEHPGWGPCYKDCDSQEPGAFQIYPDAIREHVKLGLLEQNSNT